MYSSSVIKKSEKYFRNVESFIKKNSAPEIIGIPDLASLYPRNKILEKRISFYAKTINFFRKFFSKNFLCSNIKLERTFDYLIVSHLVNYKNIKYKNDFYFGALGQKLGKKKVLFLLIDHIKVDKKKFKKNALGNYVILPTFLSFFTELKTYLKTFLILFLKSLHYPKIKIFSIDNVARSVQSQRIANQVSIFAKKFKIKKIFITFEGQPYEKLLCHQVRENNKRVICIGYQFSILRKFQHSMFLNVKKKYFPDIIFSVNNYNKKILSQNLKKKTKVFVGGVLKKEKYIFFSKNLKKFSKKFRVLVMPEGIPSEIEFFLKYCKENNNSRILFCFRMHPIFQNNNFIKNLNIKDNLNIEFSKNELDDDLKQNDYVLYRGTSAVIKAVAQGLLPIYLNNKKETTIDPLYVFNRRHFVNSDESLLKFIIKIKNKNNFRNEQKRIYNFSKNFYKDSNFKAILKVANK